jgi:hypothetical protein
LSSNGSFIEEFLKPESSLIEENFIYNPSKVYVNSIGNIYTIKYQSLMMIDAHNRFRGYIGAADLGFSIKRMFIRIFASREQKKRIVKQQPPPFINFVIAEDGLIYATTQDSMFGQIKKINSVGKNIYPEGFYGERIIGENGEIIDPFLIDIAVDKNGIISVVDKNTGKIYQYDQEGNLLAVFGGMGERKGLLKSPSSLVVDEEGLLYVLDRDLNSIQIFEPTRYTNYIHGAIKMHYEGKYEDAMSIWRKVLMINENYKLGHKGIAKALMKEKRWKEAMEEYRIADDKEGYTQAFSKYRHDFFRSNFGSVVLCIITTILLLYFLISLLYRYSNNIIDTYSTSIYHEKGSHGQMEMLKLSIAVIFHPLDTLNLIKLRRDKANYVSPSVLLLIIMTIRVIYIYMVHFPLAVLEPADTSMWIEMLKMAGPILTWVIACFAVTSILGGESYIYEIVVAATFSMIPYIVFSVPTAILSRVLTQNESGLYNILQITIWTWVIILFIVSVKTLNDYSLAQAIGVCLLSIFAMFLIWAILLLVFALTNQLWKFIEGIIRETRFKFIE